MNQRLATFLGTWGKHPIFEVDISANRKRPGMDRPADFVCFFICVQSDIAKIMVERLKQDIDKNFTILLDTKISACGSLREYSGEKVEELLYKAETNIEKAKSLGKGTIIS